MGVGYMTRTCQIYVNYPVRSNQALRFLRKLLVSLGHGYSFVNFQLDMSLRGV